MKNDTPSGAKTAMVQAAHFMSTIEANVDNKKLSDADFRQFIRNTLPIVEYARKRQQRCQHGVSELNHCVKCD